MYNSFQEKVAELVPGSQQGKQVLECYLIQELIFGLDDPSPKVVDFAYNAVVLTAKVGGLFLRILT